MNQVTRIPGEPADTQHDINATLALSGTGRAHRVKKHKAPPDFIPEVADPARPDTAAVNRRSEMSYDEAMKMLEAGKLTKSVLTPDGWVCPPEAPHPSHRKANAIRGS